MKRQRYFTKFNAAVPFHRVKEVDAGYHSNINNPGEAVPGGFKHIPEGACVLPQLFMQNLFFIVPGYNEYPHVAGFQFGAKGQFLIGVIVKLEKQTIIVIVFVKVQEFIDKMVNRGNIGG
jgi:hypothetical protein